MRIELSLMVLSSRLLSVFIACWSALVVITNVFRLDLARLPLDDAKP